MSGGSVTGGGRIRSVAGSEVVLEEARRHHRHGIEQHFASHLSDADVKALTRALEKVSAHARPLRPGRVRV